MRQLSAQLSVLLINLEPCIPQFYYPDFPPNVWELAEDISLAIRSKLKYKEADIDHLLDKL